MEIELDYRVPADDLQPFVTLFYDFHAALPRFEDIERADHAQLRFRLSGGAADYRFADGARCDAPPIHVMGATTAAVHTRADGPVDVFGMGLTPAGWAALVGADASGMLNQVICAVSLWGARMTTMADRLRAAKGIDARVALIEPFMRALMARSDDATLRFIRQVDAWLTGSSSPSVDALTAAAGLSRRHVERRCKALYGCPPKLLARKYRALRAAVAIASGSSDADTLIAEGFYDQSHMIREIKQFTGLTPRQMRDRPSALARLTIDQRRALDGQVSPVISHT